MIRRPWRPGEKRTYRYCYNRWHERGLHHRCRKCGGKQLIEVK